MWTYWGPLFNPCRVWVPVAPGEDDPKEAVWASAEARLGLHGRALCMAACLMCDLRAGELQDQRGHVPLALWIPYPAQLEEVPLKSTTQNRSLRMARCFFPCHLAATVYLPFSWSTYKVLRETCEQIILFCSKFFFSFCISAFYLSWKSPSPHPLIVCYHPHWLSLPLNL